jgi:hypothetical protein
VRIIMHTRGPEPSAIWGGGGPVGAT